MIETITTWTVAYLCVFEPSDYLVVCVRSRRGVRPQCLGARSISRHTSTYLLSDNKQKPGGHTSLALRRGGIPIFVFSPTHLWF